MAHNLNDRERVVVELWNENKTQREIALALDVSLGTVSGIAMRLKARGVIQPKSHDQVVAACQRRAREPARNVVALIIPEKPEPPPVIIPEPPVVEIPDEERIGIDIFRLTSRTCKWVLPRKNNDGLPLYCGDAVYHRSFCQCHAARAFHIPHDWRATSTPYKRLKAIIQIK